MATLLIAVVTIAIVIPVSYWSGGLTSIFTRFEKVEVKNAYVTSSKGDYVVNVEYVNTGSSPTSIDSVLLNGVPYSSYSPRASVDFGALPSECETGVAKSGKIVIPHGATDPSGNVLTDGVALVVTLHTTGGSDYSTSLTLTGGGAVDSIVRTDSGNSSDSTMNSTSTVTATDSSDETIEALTNSTDALTNSTSWLHTSGIFIYNESNQRVYLYGANCAYGGGEGLSLSDIQKLKAMGFNSFRLGIYWGLIQPSDENHFDETYFTTARAPLHHGIDDVVNWAVQEKMYIILCLCWTETWTPPTWAFPSISSPPLRYEAMFSGTASRERNGIVNTWKYIANRYRDVPNVVFELFNEPNVLNTSYAGSAYKGFNEEIISSIESVEAKSHLKMVELLYENTAWEEITATAADVNKPNLVWATHFYPPMNDYDPNGNYYHGAFTWNGRSIAEGWGNVSTLMAYRIIRCADKIHNWDKPWVVTEFSKETTQTGWKDWFNTVLSINADYNVAGWQYFCYTALESHESSWNINNPTIRQQILDLLRPYMFQGLSTLAP